MSHIHLVTLVVGVGSLLEKKFCNIQFLKLGRRVERRLVFLVFGVDGGATFDLEPIL
jgi:hypothetical protein